ncbi:hypothetical protein CVV38_02255 [Candidatus Peregrinibacteria bacterium HGW-Peregrinibacteria-1]|jgi:UPF0176 protein|nr:MAG: hypothetical protein CVV38_02255 [Candidatus Peregrinibacteria bacterium HGW-Peregrinibacteria-1]
MELRNLISKEELKARLMAEDFKRVTLSFYRYVLLDDARGLRDELFIKWSELGVFGRIYLAREGINAQLSVPEANFESFKKLLDSYEEFKDMPFKIAVEDDGKSFYKLAIKVKTKIVADGLLEEDYDVTNVGKHLDAEKFNEAMEEGAIVVDMRNHYESEVGHFEGAICPDADTFREELPMVKNALEGKEDKKVLLYCTGGIRCEKASAYLKHHGFKDVNQLHGGIIQYAHEVKSKKLPMKFKGKNFVFDERVGETISEDVISSCHQCEAKCDSHTNCRNDACHLLFIQCESCQKQYDGCCGEKCQEISKLPLEQQKEIRRKEAKKGSMLQVYKSRLRPKLQKAV